MTDPDSLLTKPYMYDIIDSKAKCSLVSSAVPCAFFIFSAPSSQGQLPEPSEKRLRGLGDLW